MNSRCKQRTYPNIINIDINMQLGYFSRDIYLSSRGHQRGAAWCWRAGCATWAPPTIINYCLHNFSMCPDCPRPSPSHTRDIFPRFPAFRLLRGANVLQFVDLKLSKVHHLDPRHVSNVWQCFGGGGRGCNTHVFQVALSFLWWQCNVMVNNKHVMLSPKNWDTLPQRYIVV